MFDISQEAVADTATLELNRANGSPLLGEGGERASITLCSPGSKTYIQAEAEAKRQIRARVDKAGGRVTAGLEGKESDEIEFFAKITVSFNNFEYADPEGGKFKSKHEMYKAFYANDALGYLHEQVEGFHKDWGNFAKS